MKRFIITESERMSIRKMYGLIREAGPYDPETEGQSPRPMDIPNTGNTIDLSQYEGDMVTLENDEKYDFINVRKKTLVGKNKSTLKWESIVDDRNLGDKSKYTYYLNKVIESKSLKNDDESFGQKINSFDRSGEPIELNLGNMTKELLQQVYNFSKEYTEAFNKFREENPKGKFCAGDLWDIIEMPDPVSTEKIKKNCNTPSYTDQIPKFLPDRRDRLSLADTMYFLIKFSNDTRAIELKKVLGIQ